MLNVNEVSRLYLGVQGENLQQTITIDVKPWLVAHPNGTCSIWHKRNGDSVPTATGAVFDAEAGVISWSPSSTDTYVAGEGEAEIRLTQGSVIKKSRTVLTGVSPAVTGAAAPLGSGWQEYINAVETLKNAAASAKSDAETAALKAEGYAIGEQNGVEVESGTYFENNAKYFAERAEQILEDASEWIREDVVEWLDEHPEATTTIDFSVAAKIFNTVADMVADISLKNGDNVATKGYYTSGDDGGTNYVVSSSHTGLYYITLNNGLYANRLSEEGMINAKTIGLKAYANKTAAAADTAGMTRNKTILEGAIANGKRIYIPDGVYAFDDCVNCNNQSLYIRGANRHRSVLYFPLSGGLYLNQNDYYNYPYIGHINIESKGKCFECTSNVKNVVCGQFEYLWMKSIDDECFVGPPENLGSVPIGQSFDTCMWGNHFFYIHGQSENGAVFANLCGSGNKWERINTYSSKYAFRNCTGQIEHYYSLGETLDHFLYYDDMIIHSGNLTLINAVAETVKKSFIYCEDSIATKFTINTLNCIDSGATYDSTVTNSTYPPIKASRINNFYVWGAHTPIPGTLSSRWDSSVLAPIYVHFGPIRQYYGLPHGIKVRGISGNYLYTLSTPSAAAVANSGNYLFQRWVYPTYNVLAADRLFGGRMHQTLDIDATELTSSNYTLPASYHNVDVINVTVEASDTVKKFSMINSDANVIGRQLVLVNNANSTDYFELQGAAGSELVNGAYYTPTGGWLTLAPGETAFLIMDRCTYNGVTKLAYRRMNYYDSPIRENYIFHKNFGVVLTSPNDTQYKLVVANDGTLSTEQVV